MRDGRQDKHVGGRKFDPRGWFDRNYLGVSMIPALLLVGWLMMINAGLGVVMLIVLAEVFFVARL